MIEDLRKASIARPIERGSGVEGAVAAPDGLCLGEHWGGAL